MQIIFVNGQNRRANWREMQEALSHPASLVLFLSAILGFRALPLTSDFPPLAPRQELMFWVHVMVTYNLGYLGAVAFWERTGRQLWTVLLQGALAGLLTVTGTLFYRLAGVGTVELLALLGFWLFLWALLLLCELFFVAFLLDLARPRPTPEGAAVPAAGMWVVHVTGRRRTMLFREVYGLLLHPVTVGLTLFVVGGMALLHPYPLLREMPLHVATQFWAHVLALFYLLFLGLAWFCRRTGITFVVPLALLICSVAVTISSVVFLTMATGIHVTHDDIMAYALFHWSVLVLTEFLVVTFVLDRVAQGAAPPLAGFVPMAPEGTAASAPALAPVAEPSPDTVPIPHPARPSLVLQGVAIPVDEVMAVAAEEHYLRIVTHDRTRLLRGRMADLEAQMPMEAGLRVHRSHWVAAQAVAGLRRSDAGWSVVVSCGREIPVARGRQSAVRAWVEGLSDTRRARP
jgi:DNA-binding LytR/AlgR family response regulator